jgi:hypothetical protein
MSRKSQIEPAGAEAQVLTLEDLPPPETRRWVARRKAQVVAAVQAGLIPLEDALRLYRLTIEEFASWQRALLRYGLTGLKASRLHMSEASERIGHVGRRWRRRGHSRRSSAHG